MQIESLFQIGAAPTPEAGAIAPTPVESPEFALTLAGLLGAPPDVPDTGPPPGVPTAPSVEEAISTMPIAIETQLDLPTETKTETTDEQPSLDLDSQSPENDEVAQAQLAAALMAASQPLVALQQQTFVPQEEAVAPVAAPEAIQIPATYPAPTPKITTERGAEVPMIEGEESGEAFAPVENPQFLPSAEFAEFDVPEAKLTVDPQLTRVGGDRELLSPEGIEFLNPVKISADVSEPVNPLTGEPFRPAEVKIEGLPSTAPKTPVEHAMKAGTPKVVETQQATPEAPATISHDSKAQLAFKDRVDMKQAFEQGLSETIERVETAPTVTPAQIKLPEVKTPVKDLELDVRSQEPVLAEEQESPSTTEVFQLKGTDKTERVGLAETSATTLDQDSAPTLSTETEVEPLRMDIPAPQVAPSQASDRIETKAKAELEVDGAKLTRQVVDRAEAFLALKREGGLTIHLEPRELGQISMSVRIAPDGVHTEIRATNQQVQVSLEANKQQLIQQVEGRGLSLGSLNVSLGQQGQGQAQQQAATQQDFARQVQMSRLMTPTSAVVSSASPTTSNRSAAGVDFLI